MGVLVFDSAPLSGFARAGSLLLLEQLTVGDERVTTPAVMDELSAGVSEHPQLHDIQGLAWLRVVPTDSLEVLRLFVIYANRLGSGVHDLGEATVLAYAEAHGAVAFSDDQAAVQLGRERGVRVQRTLSLVARGLLGG